MFSSSVEGAKSVLDKVVHALEGRARLFGEASTTISARGADEVEIMTTAPISQAVPLLTTTSSIAFAPAVAGVPEVSDPSFLQDQQGRYDPAQVVNTAFYPTGYHWKIDRNLDASEVTAADVGISTADGHIAVNITFNSAGACEWSRITNAAYAAYQANPTSPPAEAQIAIFVDSAVLSAPEVTGGGQFNQTQITGNFTQNHALALADAISASALPAVVSVVTINRVAPTSPTLPTSPTPTLLPVPMGTPLPGGSPAPTITPLP